MSGSFGYRVTELVSSIPSGKVMTYGQIASLVGNARAARIVGGIAHYGDPDIPWHRVVNKKGGLASGYPGGRLAHKCHLESEGIEFIEHNDEYFLDIEQLLWWPKK